ncbi:FAD-dependent monooxygenase [Nonomuraea typhae]|uniref:FAD-dependent monooxygenase n=1 Tax=Nonomuraea typhae TaxID=2603600 RepID=A0ABW7YWC7_9ACTN
MRNVLITGAGPTGLTLAVDLARRGVPFRIVDRSPAHPTGVRGKGLQPRTLEVFDDLGVIDEILATGSTYPPIRSRAGGEVVWEGRMSEIKEPSAAVPYPNLIMQPQWRTERILRDRLAALGHEVEPGVELTGFEQDADGVTAVFGDSSGTRKPRSSTSPTSTRRCPQGRGAANGSARCSRRSAGPVSCCSPTRPRGTAKPYACIRRCPGRKG